MSGKYSAWKEAAWVFLLSRLLFVSLTLFSLLVLPQLLPNYAQHIASEDHFRFPLYSSQSVLYSWLHWDVKAFLNISHVGYHHTPDVAFFPLWPLVQSMGALLLGDSFPASFYFAGLILANLCFYIALVLFYQLLSKDFGPLLARRALFCLAFSPYALFYFAGYSESLFLVLCLAVFLFLRRGTLLDWWLAGIVSFFAVLTRSSGVALVLPYLWMYFVQFWQGDGRLKYTWKQKLAALAPISLIPSAILTYMYYLYLTKGSPFIFRLQEEMVWHRQLTMPWETLKLLIHAFTTQTTLIVANILDVFFMLVAIITLALSWRLLPWHYRLFALALVLFVISFPTHTLEPLASQPRYMLSIFPIIVIYALWSKNSYFYRSFVAVTLLLLAINTVFFLGNYWVA